MKPFATGLVVGKFAPLHCGHEKRLTWLQVRFPQATFLVLTPELVARYNLPAIPHNNADADIHRHYVATLCLQILRCRPHAVFTAEDYGDGFANVLARRFAQPVEHVRMARPVGDEAPSGTLIRSDVHRYRYMLANLPVKARFQKRWRACLIRCMSLNLAATIGKKKTVS